MEGNGCRTEKAGDISHLDLELALRRQVKERFALRDDILGQLFIDAGVLDVEEPHIQEGVTQRHEEIGLGLWVSRE